MRNYKSTSVSVKVAETYTCYSCDGKGLLDSGIDEYGRYVSTHCHSCNGLGTVYLDTVNRVFEFVDRNPIGSVYTGAEIGDLTTDIVKGVSKLFQDIRKATE